MAITPELIGLLENAKNRPVPAYTHFYGMDYLLKKLLGLPEWLQLDIHLDHGIIIRLDAPDQYLARTKSNLILVDNQIRKNMVPEKKNVFVSGPLYIRFRRKYGFKYNPAAKGTIVFPTHSSHHLSLQLDWKKYAEMLLALPVEFQPVTVCMYWLDVLNGDHKYFEDLGIDVITNGHMFDKNYAFNFYSNISKFKYASGNEPGSFLFYAVEMGMPFFMFGPDARVVKHGDDPTVAKDFEFNDIDYARKLKEVFRLHLLERNSFRITPEQYNLTNLVINDKDWIDLKTLKSLILGNASKLALLKIKKSSKRFLQNFRSKV